MGMWQIHIKIVVYLDIEILDFFIEITLLCCFIEAVRNLYDLS